MGVGKDRHRSSARALRPPMRSPGRPPGWRREHQEAFWIAIGRGLSSEDAAAVAAVSPAVGTRWFREFGGIAPDLGPIEEDARLMAYTAYKMRDAAARQVLAATG